MSDQNVLAGAPAKAGPWSPVNFLKSTWLLWALVALAAVGGILSDVAKLHGMLTFLSQKDLDLVRALTPLSVAAIFIERAVEVLISPWRDPDANKKATAVATATAAQAANPNGPDGSVDNLMDDLNDYKGNTKKIAFLLAFLLSLVASLAGVRALGPFLATNGVDNLTQAQKTLFYTYDTLLTAVLLPGGADLVHSVFTAITSVFNATSQKAQKAAGS